MYLTATSSLVFLSLTSLATPKFPEPRSFIASYLSSIPTQLTKQEMKHKISPAERERERDKKPKMKKNIASGGDKKADPD